VLRRLDTVDNVRHNFAVFVTCYTAGGLIPDVLKQVMLPLIDIGVCNQTGWFDGHMDDSMICAGYQEGGQGICQVS